MPTGKKKSRSRGRKSTKSTSIGRRSSTSHGRSSSRSTSYGARNFTGNTNGNSSAGQFRKPRRLRSTSKSKQKLYPMGHDKKRTRSKSKPRLRDGTCASEQVMGIASETMNLSELQRIAKKKGIAFGGLNKKQLVRKICEYS